jgi:hypothetical protein
MPGRQSRAWRGLPAQWRQLMAARTKLHNVVRGILRQEDIWLPARNLPVDGWR